ncbi:MAG: glycogen branching enzyme2C GH-57-type2C archaeal [Segetibacter sp.]|nr:glycogen branching enzyme2C GH-57-type2C archaeal [Segetibacter sp.]
MQTDITIILNTHMPYVLGKGQIFDEPENWLFEAITETYIPLFQALSRWDSKYFAGKKIILSMTPCLVNQLTSCKERYVEYLLIMQKIAFFEIERTQKLSLFKKYEKWGKEFSEQELKLFNQSAHFYLQRINDSLDFMSKHDLVEFLKNLLENRLSHIELWTSSPDHNFLPFFEKKTSDYLIKRGVELFSDVFNRAPDGFWLPECAFRPGVEDGLVKAGIHQTALTTHAIGVFHPDVKSGVYQHGDLRLLIHDYRLSMHIWKTPIDTLPSHPIYREFYRDIGMDVVPEYFDNLGITLPPKRRGAVWTGMKYHACTGKDVELHEKNIYDLAAAREQVLADVPKFIQILETKRDLVYDRKTFIMAFDTELFGHWWHEGVNWLENLLQYDLSAEQGNSK